jgi:hypothetical protein
LSLQVKFPVSSRFLHGLTLAPTDPSSRLIDLAVMVTERGPKHGIDLRDPTPKKKAVGKGGPGIDSIGAEQSLTRKIQGHGRVFQESDLCAGCIHPSPWKTPGNAQQGPPRIELPFHSKPVLRCGPT